MSNIENIFIQSILLSSMDNRRIPQLNDNIIVNKDNQCKAYNGFGGKVIKIDKDSITIEGYFKTIVYPKQNEYKDRIEYTMDSYLFYF